MSVKFQGVITALATPFKNGEVDRASFSRLLKQQTEQGITGFVINGTTGESPTLTFPEVKSLFEIARAETKAQLIIGTGLNSTAKTIEFSQSAAALKPDGLLVVVPYYNKPPQRGLASHFRAVADSVKVPIILYNVPGRTVANLEPKTVGELSQHPNIAGIKDATGKIEVLKEIQQHIHKDFALLSGDDLTSIDFIAQGGHGVISVSSHIIGKEMIAAAGKAKQDSKEGAKEGDRFKATYNEFMKHLYIEANPIPVKAALNWMKVFDSPELRLPLTSLDNIYHQEFRQCLAQLGK